MPACEHHKMWISPAGKTYGSGPPSQSVLAPILLHWDDPSGQMVTQMPTPPLGAGDRVEMWWENMPQLLHQLPRIVEQCESLCRAERNPPEKRGLVAVRSQNPEHTGGKTGARMAAPDDGFRLTRQPSHPDPGAPFNRRWVAAGTDPWVYGTVFASPRRALKPDGSATLRWVATVSGTRTVLASAEWDDDDGCVDVFRIVTDSVNDAESVAVQVAMSTHPEVLASALQTEQELRSEDALFEHFSHPKFRVKPRVVARIFNDGAAEGVTGWPDGAVRDVNITHVRIRRRARHGARERAYAAVVASLTVKRDGDASTVECPPFDLWAGEVHRSLTGQNLGGLFRSRHKTGGDICRMIVTHQPDALYRWRHLPWFGPDADIEQCIDVGGAPMWVPYSPAAPTTVP